MNKWLDQLMHPDRDTAVHPWRWRLLTLWIIVFSLGYYSNYRDIQNGRVASCKQTYEGVRQVFQPFFPEKGEPVTKKQKDDIKIFNDTVDRLKANCGKQTKVE